MLSLLHALFVLSEVDQSKKNGCRKDVEEALQELQCEVKWEGGICPNPQYDRLVEITAVISSQESASLSKFCSQSKELSSIANRSTSN